MRSESHDLFKFWEIIDKISETVQDSSEIALLPVPLSDLGVTFAVRNLYNFHSS